ncbi:MAG: MBL fold metallo-hydrolase [Pirellulaceae bacterium]
MYWIAWAGVFWLGPIGTQNIWNTSQDEWSATIVDVGHGSSVLVEVDKYVLLYDAGSFGSVEAGSRSISSVLWTAGIERIDVLVISHADIDHFNAVPDLCQRFRVGSVWVPEHFLTSDQESVRYVMEELRARNVSVTTIHRGMSGRIGQLATWTCLSPGPEPPAGSDNSKSIVMLIEGLGKRLILPGDLEDSGMETLLLSKAIDVDVALSPHHGSAGSAQGEFVAWCKPELVVVSGKNKVRESDRSSPATWLSTDDEGAIRIHFKRDHVTWQSWVRQRGAHGIHQRGWMNEPTVSLSNASTVEDKSEKAHQ